MHYKIISAAIAAASLSSTSWAGGYAAPVVDVEPVAPIVTAPVGDWQGAYGGLALGYALAGDDEIGVNEDNTTFLGNIGTAEIGGPNLSVHAGYRWQRNQWVFGPELSYTAGDISDDFDYGIDGTFESEVNHVIALKLKAGYQVRPDMLVYGIAGLTKGDFTYVVDGSDLDYDADGYVVGLGAEKKLNDRMSVTGEWEFNDFGTTDVDLGDSGFTTVATPKFHNLKLGLNFKF
ncbi:MAG TPA: porin family protein [Paracoccus sp. (in: a-proteobacteria)]|nr:porin family protein [Paracoccus sp. (in: a-proteobacteria)]